MEVANKKRIINAWCMYDWANSVYNLVIASAIFPIYYTAMTTTKDTFGTVISDRVDFLGMSLKNTVLSSYTLAFSLLLVCIISPFFSGIADLRGNRKKFLRIFCYLGAASCASLFFFTDKETTLWVGILFMMLASLGFYGSLVFYNSFLPQIAEADEMDKISAKGFSLGYLGSSLLLIVCLILIKSVTKEMEGDATRICFLLVGLWWASFAQLLFRRVPEKKKAKTEGSIFKGFHELQKVYKQVVKDNSIKNFLSAFLFYSMGVQTVVLVASYFGSKVLSLGPGKLIPTILIIQFVGVAGSFFFSWVSKKRGNKFSLMVTLLIWIAVCMSAWYIAQYHNTHPDLPNMPVDRLPEYGFYGLAFFVGLVMGGVQSLSRSTYSKLIPEHTNDTASFFSFYDITEKVAMVFGLFIFGFIEEHSSGMENSVLALIVFFVIGFLVLLSLKDKRLEAY
ncbi:MAG: MFS transporter [Flavobacteriaceae bacterium]|nr:MFS transporter [Flavobacteriaceae bacterium]